jgi:hypothetical protein
MITGSVTTGTDRRKTAPIGAGITISWARPGAFSTGSGKADFRPLQPEPNAYTDQVLQPRPSLGTSTQMFRFRLTVSLSDSG